MRWLARLLVTFILSTFVVLLLSILPQLEDGWDSPAFMAAKAEPFSELNIVDVMNRLHLQLRIRKLEVSNAIISIDLFTSATSDRKEIMQDMYTISQAMLTRSSNINQVLIRVLDGTQKAGANHSLLLALDARRDKFSRSGHHSVVETSQDIEAYLRSYAQFTYTRNWQEKFEINN